MRLKTVLISSLVSASCMVVHGENTKDAVVITKRDTIGIPGIMKVLLIFKTI